MFENFLKTAFRNLLRNKFYSIINIIGLSIGITACILILLYVQSELSYDKFHENVDRIYRVNLYAVLSDDEINQPVTNPPLANAIQNEIPEVEEAVRITNFNQPVIRHDDDVFNETKWYFTDPNFFKVFTAHFILGNPENALVQPKTVVLTETTANRYFGNENPLGQHLSWENDGDYIVTGVIKDFPENSHIKPDFLASMKGHALDQNMQWINNMLYTYFLIKPGYTKQDVDIKLEGLVKKYVGPAVKQYMGVSLEDLVAQGMAYQWYAQPLSAIHFDKEVSAGPEPLGNRSYMVIFSIIAIFILVIACINYMNMSTARSANRAKEVGIKKSLGSNRNFLVTQFLSESVFVTLIALALALVIIKLLLPGFNNLIGKQLVFNYFDNFNTIPLMIAFGIGIGIIAGSYPAFFLASYNPVKVIKGIHKSEGSHGSLRSGLVIFQLIVTIVLFSGTFFISKQLSFLQNKDLGFNKENLIIINKANYLDNRMSSFKSELLAQSGIQQISNTTSIPGRIHTSRTFYYQTAQDSRGMNTLGTDQDFLKTYQIKLKEGRFFEESTQSDGRLVVLNESAVKTLNIEDPVGKQIYQGQKTDEAALTIIGVVKDFHCESLYKEMSPIVLFKNSGENLSIRISGDIQQNIKKIEETWNKFANGQSLDYVFFDEDFGRLYKAEKQTRKIVTIFSGLAIFIACLGLLALAAFVAEQRTKEIGVRKVNGARISEILLSLNQNFIKCVGIAFVFAVPGAWYLLYNWLGNFAYKTSLSWWVFVLAGVSALIITVVTVSWQSWRAATRNPVEALRYE